MTIASATALVHCSGLVAGYGKGRNVLNGVSVEIGDGEFVGLAGPNGTGKTTLLHCLTGYQRPRQGHVLLESQDIATLSRRQISARIAFVPQKTESVFSFSVLQMVLMGRHPYAGLQASDSQHDVDLALESLNQLNISDLADRQYDQLSGGEKQLVLLARAFAQQAPVLVLNEPLTGLDLRHQFELMNAVRQATRDGGKAALATFHDLSTAARWCDRLILLHNGKVLANGPPAEVITPENLRILYNVTAEIHRNQDGLPLSISVSSTE